MITGFVNEDPAGLTAYLGTINTATGTVTFIGRTVNNLCAIAWTGVNQPFTSCIQDGSNGAILQLNSTTGDYLFTNCRGVTISGTGTLIKRGSMLSLQDMRADRRVVAKVDGSARQGTASVQLFSPLGTFTIIDRNTADNTCSCQ